MRDYNYRYQPNKISDGLCLFAITFVIVAMALMPVSARAQISSDIVTAQKIVSESATQNSRIIIAGIVVEERKAKEREGSSATTHQTTRMQKPAVDVMTRNRVRKTTTIKLQHADMETLRKEINNARATDPMKSAILEGVMKAIRNQPEGDKSHFDLSLELHMLP